MISLEMGDKQLCLRDMAAESGIPASFLQRGSMYGQHDWDRLEKAAGRLAELPIYFHTAAYSDRQISRTIDEMAQVHGCKVLAVDYLQLGYVEDHAGSREQEIARISNMLKRKAKEHNIPVIALAQLNRGVEYRKERRPMLADLRESGSIEQDADIIIFIHREEVYEPCKCAKDIDCICGRRGRAELIVGKGRNVGTALIQVMFDAKVTTFRDLAPEGRA